MAVHEPLDEKRYSVVGKSVQKIDGIGHVTAATRYVDDLQFANLQHTALIRSPYRHARILSIDTSAAERLPGVSAVVTYRDVANNIHGLLQGAGVQPDEPLLAELEVCFVGQPIAAVAAESLEIAREAARLVSVEYEELPAVMEALESMKPGAPPVRTAHDVYPNHYIYAGHPFRRVRYGDYESAIQRADHIVQGSYSIAPIEHAPIETQVSVSVPDASGKLVVYSTTQAMYFTMGNLASLLGIPLSKVKFIGGTVGGGFGGKVDGATEPITALLALKSGLPVKWRFTREEENLYSSTRSGVYIDITDGVLNNGRVIARKVRTVQDTGAYNRTGPYGTNKNANHAQGPYDIPNVWIDGWCVYTNRQPASAMRGFGVFEATFPLEVQMEKIARTIGMDPWELRFRNVYRRGSMTAAREPLHTVAIIETMKAAAEAAGIELTAEQRAMTSDSPLEAIS